MKLEYGKCYLDRSGRIMGPLVPSTAPSVVQGFLFRHGWHSWKIDGSFRAGSKGNRPVVNRPWPDRLDLVCEVRNK